MCTISRARACTACMVWCGAGHAWCGVGQAMHASVCAATRCETRHRSYSCRPDDQAAHRWLSGRAAWMVSSDLDVRRRFNAYDKDQSGQLSHPEVRQICADLHYDVGEEYVEGVMQEFTNEKGWIGYPEFGNLWQHLGGEQRLAMYEGEETAMRVTVPAGVQAGGLLTVATPDGNDMVAEAVPPPPNDAYPGERSRASATHSQWQHAGRRAMIMSSMQTEQASPTAPASAAVSAYRAQKLLERKKQKADAQAAAEAASQLDNGTLLVL